MTTNQTIDGVPRRVCHACVTYPRNAYCPVCDPAVQPQGEPVSRALKYLARVLDEDQFKTVEDMLYTEQPAPVAVAGNRTPFEIEHDAEPGDEAAFRQWRQERLNPSL